MRKIQIDQTEIELTYAIGHGLTYDTANNVICDKMQKEKQG